MPMDTLSIPALTSLRISGHHSTPGDQQHHNFIKNSTSNYPSPSHFLSSTYTNSDNVHKPNFVESLLKSKKASLPQLDSRANLNATSSYSRTPSPTTRISLVVTDIKRYREDLAFETPSLRRAFHQRAASGYAAALLDKARCNNSLESMAKDVRKFTKCLRNEQLRAIMNDPLVEEKAKGKIIKEIAEKGKFHKHLAVLLKLLADKNRAELVNEFVVEFERMYDELSGTTIVLVPTAEKLKQHQLFGIAKRVAEFSGAVKVKIKNFVYEKQRMFSFPLRPNCYAPKVNV